ncbi:hypothetical protein ACFLSQ_00370 [Bacteroidota bacterium]
MKKLIIIITTGILSLLFSISCSTTEKAKNNEDKPLIKQVVKEGYELAAWKKYSGGIMYIPNSLNTYMLCISQEKPNAENPFPALKFFIFDMEKQEIVYEESLENGFVNWRNDYQIRIDLIPGQVKSDEESLNYYIYDLKKKKKYIDELIKEN